MGDYQVAQEMPLEQSIAIIGIACRLPGDCNSPHSLWEMLRKARRASNTVPSSRFRNDTSHDPSDEPGRSQSISGCFLENVNLVEFDGEFFGISAEEAMCMEPQQQLLLEVVYECLENAGLSLAAINGHRMGCFVGCSESVNLKIMRKGKHRTQKIVLHSKQRVSVVRVTTIDAACSGSLAAVELACRYLVSNDISAAIVAGANIILNPERLMDCGQLAQDYSPTGQFLSRGAQATRYDKGEGVSCVILKRLDDALREGDPIRAIIRGWASNNDGRRSPPMCPRPDSQAACIRAAYAMAKLTDFETTAYIECHGMGTAVGESFELKGISAVFGQTRSTNNPLIVGSIKSSIGDSEAASGLSGLIKITLSIEEGLIPGTPSCPTLSSKVNYQELNLRSVKSTIPWPRASIKRAGINSFGYGGTNCHIIVEEAQQLLDRRGTIPHRRSFLSTSRMMWMDEDEEEGHAASQSSSCTSHVLLISAHKPLSLQYNKKEILRHLASLNVRVDLGDLAYTLSDRRSHHFHRAYSVVTSSTLHQARFVDGMTLAREPRIGFIFTGQGSQWSQMGTALIKTFPEAARRIKHLDNVLQSLPNCPTWSLLDELTKTRDPEILRRPEFSEPLSTALQLAILAVMENHRVRPHCVVGHSSGEIAAAYVAGYLTLDDAIKIAFFRGQAAQGACDSFKEKMGMMAVELDQQTISKYFIGLEDKVHIACHNSPSNVTLAGILSALEEVQACLQQGKHASRMLQVDIPYHSKFITATAEAFEQFFLQESPLVRDLGCSGDVTMLSTVTGRRLEGPACKGTYWRANMESPVLFRHAMEEILLHDQRPDVLVEIGPSDTLRGPVTQLKHSLGQEDGPLKEADIQYLSALRRGDMSARNMLHLLGSLYLSGYPIQMQGAYPRLSEEAPSVIVDLPNYCWSHTAKHSYECVASKDWQVRKSKPGLGASENGVIASNIAKLTQSMQNNLKKTCVPGEYSDLLSEQLSNMLRLTRPIDPERLLSSYGLDSLSKIQLRLWLNTQLSVDVSTFDIINAPTLASLREMVAEKLRGV
ncbi:type I polyketide synthase [Aspergillus thermomutatus]|uniref:Uncharacterized protein n=1 Tax=Aspergillus thermomutatus TaxID=41047 RepID=A0A397G5W6_ASPTH|nr:uncharacterized protein CDV56_101535 [Aspergillus thermomutatus]RHZ46412.1 hypothetical protein CDV56_101535 [Aspergillus thermomutatus]ULE36145.1 ThmK [Aspergillus thermomutatus]